MVLSKSVWWVSGTALYVVFGSSRGGRSIVHKGKAINVVCWTCGAISISKARNDSTSERKFTISKRL